MNPRNLLRAVDTLLAGAGPSLGSCWQRACAALLRTALEQTLRQYWQRRAPTVSRASMRSQLLVLPVVTNETVTALARGAWNGLCRAVHHHTYELPPTVAELRGWYDDVDELIRQLHPPT